MENKDVVKPIDKRLINSLSIEDIIKQYGTYIYNLALRLSADPEKADDIVQEIFIKAWHIIER